jgi:hypothetical protein
MLSVALLPLVIYSFEVRMSQDAFIFFKGTVTHYVPKQGAGMTCQASCRKPFPAFAPPSLQDILSGFCAHANQKAVVSFSF